MEAMQYRLRADSMYESRAQDECFGIRKFRFLPNQSVCLMVSSWLYV